MTSVLRNNHRNRAKKKKKRNITKKREEKTIHTKLLMPRMINKIAKGQAVAGGNSKLYKIGKKKKAVYDFVREGKMCISSVY